MKKAKKTSLVISAVLLLTFAVTYFYPKENVDFATRNYLTLINNTAFFGFVIALYLSLLFYDIDSGKLCFSKIVFYSLLLSSIGTLIYFCFRWASVSAYIFATAVIQFMVMYFVRQFFMRESPLSLRKEFLALPIFIAVIVFLMFLAAKEICF